VVGRRGVRQARLRRPSFARADVQSVLVDRDRNDLGAGVAEGASLTDLGQLAHTRLGADNGPVSACQSLGASSTVG
jgi:hypothetical protein